MGKLPPAEREAVEAKREEKYLDFGNMMEKAYDEVQNATI